MRAYYRPSKQHKITLQLTPDDAVALLESLDMISLDPDVHDELIRARRMLNRAFDQYEESLP